MTGKKKVIGKLIAYPYFHSFFLIKVQDDYRSEGFDDSVGAAGLTVPIAVTHDAPHLAELLLVLGHLLQHLGQVPHGGL